MFVWISGGSHYETTSFISMLKNCGIMVRDFRAGSRLCSGDTLALCLSSAPLLEWCRYIKITQWERMNFFS